MLTGLVGQLHDWCWTGLVSPLRLLVSHSTIPLSVCKKGNTLCIMDSFMSTLHPANLGTLTLICALVICGAAQARESAHLTFEKHVRPILKAHCFQCHGEDEELSGDLDVRLVRLLLAGGESGPVVVPEKPDESLLWQQVATDEMPKGPKKLSIEQKDIIRRWILQGARTIRPEPKNVADIRFSYEELSHWAWQAVSRPAIPQVDGFEFDTPIDAFVARRLAEYEFGFSSVADKRTLIRRATFSVLGLPPTPAEVEQFVADESPDAWKILVERLLSSPQFGVRWGRHWLDVAGYAETNGDQNGDTQRPHAWRYRDYVINSFNSNKSIDQFYVEQVAGDELISGNVDIHNARHLELLTATGFLRMAPDTTQSSNALADRNRAVSESIKVITSSMLGLTVGCAQCHDHKYDPVGIDDYYRFRAIFDPVFPLEKWQQPSARLLDFTTANTQIEAERVETECKVLQDELARRRKAHAATIFEQKLADVPDADRTVTREAIETPANKQTNAQKILLDLYPMVKTVDFITGFLVEYDISAHQEFEKEARKIADLRATRPSERMVMATREQPGVVPVSLVFHRGNPQSPGDEVVPAEIMVLNRGRNMTLPVNDDRRPSTGRRLAWVRQLTDGSHPLAARVFVNRVWLHYFGRGLVATPGDFGISGEPPSHPELLDWLASDFVRHGWDHKRLHRLILLSRTWQQVTTRSIRLNSVDPRNSLLGRMSLRRLAAEEIRDAVLSTADLLCKELGGPSLPVTKDTEGKAVIGRRLQRDGIKTSVEGAGAERAPRSVYIQVQRKLPLNMLATFDQPVMTPNCALRRPTTVATQSLWFLNDAEIVRQSEHLAQLLMDRHEDRESQLRHLFVRLFSEQPSDDQIKWCLEFLDVQSTQLENSTAGEDDETQDTRHSGLATLCQTLFASNRFLYVD